MALAIEIEGLSKDFQIGFWKKRPYRALDGLNLQVEQGEVFGFLGPNGSGKSTTIKLLMQLIFPTAGSARILGLPAGDLSTRSRIGYLAENPYYYDYLSAEELLTYFAKLFGFRGADVAARVSRVLDEVQLGAERRMRLRQFSKGMIQRVGLAQALINDPDIVFLDEPMSGLDPLGRRRVRDVILRLRQRGTTVFFSSHILSDAEALCTRVAILAQGRLVSSGRLTEILAFELKGWEMVVADLSEERRRQLGPQVRETVALPDGRWALHLAPDAEPERLMSDLHAEGVRVVSLNPVRETLEDFFVQKVKAAVPRITEAV